MAVTSDQARTAAKKLIPWYAQTRRSYADWRGAVPGAPTTYYGYGPDGDCQPTAYVVPVEHRSGERRSAGHTTIAARRSVPPVLEYGQSRPPSETISHTGRTSRRRPAADAVADGRLLYQGGLDFGIEADAGEMIRLRSQRRTPVRPVGSLHRSVDDTGADRARRSWATLLDDTADLRREYGTADTSLSFGAYAWDGHYGEGDPVGDDTGGASYPNCRGTPDDSWDGWDGCSPVAGTQIVMYHEGLENTDANLAERETICDALHELMDTNDSGWSNTWNIDNGFDNLANELDGKGTIDGSYNGDNEYNISKGLIQSEIDDGQPCMLTNYSIIPNGDPTVTGPGAGSGPRRMKKGGSNYDGHSIVITGYNTGTTMEVDVYDGWSTQQHTIAYGSWAGSSVVTRVVP